MTSTLAWKSPSWNKAKCKVLHGVGQSLLSIQTVGWIAWEEYCGKGFAWTTGQNAEHEPAAHTCTPESQLYPGPTKSQETILPLSSAVVRPDLEYYVQLYRPQHQKDMAISAQIHNRATKLFNDMEQPSRENRMKELGLCCLENPHKVSHRNL